MCMGVIGLGDIGKATATLAKAFRMKVIGCRRNTTIAEDEVGVVVRGWCSEGCAGVVFGDIFGGGHLFS